jgi:hypothetical protein
VLADRGESGSKFGRATFSVLLLQDLAVVVLLMLIPLLAPSPDGATGGWKGTGRSSVPQCPVTNNALQASERLPRPPFALLTACSWRG